MRRVTKSIAETLDHRTLTVIHALRDHGQVDSKQFQETAEGVGNATNE
jgi:hypothetical protein